MRRPPRNPEVAGDEHAGHGPRGGEWDTSQDIPRSISAAERSVVRQLAALAAVTPDDAPRIENLYRTYLEEILGWTRDSNLVARGDLGRLASRHLAESVAALSVLDRLAPATMLDLGSGAGFPAVPIQIARPQLRVTLVESRRRKGLFLARVVQALELESATVLIERAEHLEVPADGGFDLATARAVAPVGELLGWMTPMVKPGGHALLFKGSSHGEEIRAWEELGRKSGTATAWELEGITPVEDRHLYLTLLRRLPG
jgi:16S rRNA (guanine527-N7)-methyltransferase